jgi:hypothetical protein
LIIQIGLPYHGKTLSLSNNKPPKQSSNLTIKFKNGKTIVFISAAQTDTLQSIKEQLVQALNETSTSLKGKTTTTYTMDDIRLQGLDNLKATITESGLVDTSEVGYVRRLGGEWEEFAIVEPVDEE